jgi:hypothetical protein
MEHKEIQSLMNGMGMNSTAVEWLIDWMGKNQYFIGNDLLKAAEQAKIMEENQSIDFARLCLNKAKDLDILSAFMNAQQYYNETFKSE